MNKEWWERSFDKGIYPLISISREWKTRTAQEVKGIKKLTGLKKGQRLLDVACGVGRHSIELAEAGIEVTGVDYSRAYLREAKQQARARGVFPRFDRLDMRALPYQNEFDAATLLFSSFGYFKNASDDLKTVKGICRALRPGGKFLFDNLNPLFLKKHFRPKDWFELTDGTCLLEQRTAPDRENRVTTKWIFFSGGKRSDMESTIRLYTASDFTKLLKQAGFSSFSIYGSLEGAPFEPQNSNRLVVLARKKG